MVAPYRRQPQVQTGPIGERMIALVEKYYPYANEIYVSSAMDGPHGNVSHHYGNLHYAGSPTAAIDFGAYDDPSEDNDTKDQWDMGLLADWLWYHFPDLTVELIHTQPHNNHLTYVRDQERCGPYAEADHVNHIHWATSAALMDRIEARARDAWGAGLPLTLNSSGVQWTGTSHLLDLSSHQVGIDLAAVRDAGFTLANIKTTQGNWYTWDRAREYTDRARALGFGLMTYHWLDNSASGREQADIAYRGMLEIGGPAGMGHQCDCEDIDSPATFEIWRDYVNAMQDRLGRPIINYTGDWWWVPKGWTGGHLTPYLWAAPNNGYLDGYPGDSSPDWHAGYGGWGDYAALQYSVGPVEGAGSIKVSKTAIRDASVWAALTGEGDDMTPGQDYRLRVLMANWDPTRDEWIRAGGSPASYDDAEASGGARNGLKQALSSLELQIAELHGKLETMEAERMGRRVNR
ncbi:GH25 family lysozyme [Longispora albida]|uniref:GH25 family lysozyme n=1 Tax=Longispora albida TaxID=203523 RepID=UPI00039C8B7E|nr:GH25 family lysozyme [Longispora albida]